MRNTRNQRLDYLESIPLKQRRVEVIPRTAAALTLSDTSSHSDSDADPAVSLAPTPFLSSRNLDFCLLAVCSCVLAVLCHQTVLVPTSSTVSTPSAAAPAQLDFTLKSALFTSAQQKDDTKAFFAE